MRGSRGCPRHVKTPKDTYLVAPTRDDGSAGKPRGTRVAFRSPTLQLCEILHWKHQLISLSKSAWARASPAPSERCWFASPNTLPLLPLAGVILSPRTDALSVRPQRILAEHVYRITRGLIQFLPIFLRCNLSKIVVFSFLACVFCVSNVSSGPCIFWLLVVVLALSCWVVLHLQCNMPRSFFDVPKLLTFLYTFVYMKVVILETC